MTEKVPESSWSQQRGGLNTEVVATHRQAVFHQSSLCAKHLTYGVEKEEEEEEEEEEVPLH